MRLNPDCIRDILITVEENTSFNSFMEYPLFNKEYDRLSKYPRDEVFYHIKQCELSRFFTKVSWTMNPSCLIADLSPLGHEFIADIRSDNNWTKTKDIAGQVGSSSLRALKDIAVEVVSSVISKSITGS